MNIFYIIFVVVVLAVVAAFFVYEKKALAEAARYYPQHPWKNINRDLRASAVEEIKLRERRLGEAAEPVPAAGRGIDHDRA